MAYIKTILTILNQGNERIYKEHRTQKRQRPDKIGSLNRQECPVINAHKEALNLATSQTSSHLSLHLRKNSIVHLITCPTKLQKSKSAKKLYPAP